MSPAGFWIVLLLGCTALCHAAPTIAPTAPTNNSTVSPEEQDLAKEYVSQFYSDVGTKNTSLRSLTNNTFREDLEAMQAFFGLEVTGVVNNETITIMKSPRCGVSDISRYGHFAGKPRWQKRLVTYRITRYTPDLTQREVDTTIGQAFQLYSDVIPLDFKQIYSGTADIMILFKGGYHGDFYPFDGAGGVLAHANSPGQNQGGDTHFDDDETWTLTRRGVNLLLVAAHEFGHALGLDHSRDRRALMFPTYQYVNTYGYRLPDDDRRGVQALYGSRKPQPTAKPTQPAPDPEPEPEEPTEDPLTNPKDEQCSRGLVFDAATSIKGELYFFKNGYYWRKNSRGIRLTKVSRKWPRIQYVDAAFEVPNKDVVYLFEGNQYWGIRASGLKAILPGYPKSLTSLGLPSSVSKVDAAVYVPTTGKTLIFVNRQYWSYDESRNRMDYGYPRLITWDFSGIGSKVDAAFENYVCIFIHHPEGNAGTSLRYSRYKSLVFLSRSVSSQTDEERQQALQAFTAQTFLGSPQQNTISSSGSGASVPAFPSPASSSEHKTKMKRGPRKNQNEKYRLKYLRLRKTARAMIFENAALCDEVAHLEEKFLRAKEERRFLLKSLLQYQSLSEGEILPTPSSSSHPPVPPVALTSGPAGASGLSGGHNLAPVVSTVEDGALKKPKKERKERGRENGKEELPKKMSKKRKLADGSRKLVQPIPLDSSGRPVFPIVLGGLTVYSLGEFEIVPEEDPQNAIVASSALTCHSNLLKAIASVSSKSVVPIVPSGADFFGFSHPTIQNLIQSCPGARKCSNYRWIRFEVCRPGDGQVPHSLSEDDASVNFDAYQRHQGFDENIKMEHIAGQTPQSPSSSHQHHLTSPTMKPSTSYFNS
ncbi:Collagenase 3 [Larimichthys crocea]|uniref:Uncharacterized protein n=1 Tax=Larimichthys crocea TaxID=215358 RepID=A0ACD3QJZ8_LARCR|nr:Collagenase 3 [Larimichthys crocea]